MIIRTLNISFLIMGILLISSCSQDEPKIVIPLIANAGMNQTGSVGELITLDGTESTGPEGFTYHWTYEGEQNLVLQDSKTANPFFIPPVNDIYLFTLTIIHNNDSSEANVGVTISGAMEIGGMLDADLELHDIEPDSELPDYIISEDLIVPEGITLSVVEDNVTLAFLNGSGLKVDGSVTNKNNESTRNLRLTGNDWKGIYVDKGSISLNHTIIENAGAVAFIGASEAAALTLTTSSSVSSFIDNEFLSTPTIDILGLGDLLFTEQINANFFSAPIPYKGGILFHQNMGEDNVFPDNYIYVHLVPKGLDSPEGAGTSLFETAKYFIDGDVNFAELVFIKAGAQFIIKEGSGIVINKGLYSLTGDSIVYSGLDGASWKGFLIQGSRSSYFINSVIENAGVGLFNGTTANTAVEAVITNTTSFGTEFNGCRITGSNGFGYYHDYDGLILPVKLVNSTFEDLDDAAIRSNTYHIAFMLDTGHNSTFQINNNRPAILIQGNNGEFRNRWPSIGNNYYLVDTDLVAGGFIDIDPGVTFKMARDRSIIWIAPIISPVFEVIGTAESPIIFEGLENTQGYWKGIYVHANFQIDHVIIRDAGGGLLGDATVPANLALYGHFTSTISYMRNVHLANSAGYGFQELSSGSGVEDPANNVTFNNNALGDISN